MSVGSQWRKKLSWHNRKQRLEVMTMLRPDDTVWAPKSSLAGATPESSLSCKLINSIFTLGQSGLGFLSCASTHFLKDLLCLIWEKGDLVHKHQHNLVSPLTMFCVLWRLHSSQFLPLPLPRPYLSEHSLATKLGHMINTHSFLYLFVTAVIIIVVEYEMEELAIWCHTLAVM